jgi:putative acetyltransferase
VVSRTLRNVLIRPEELKDYPAVHAVNVSAFETSTEANLVEVLRIEAYPIASLVAKVDGTIVGHIMFSPVSLSDHADLKIMGLGPMAVLAKRQRKGIGSRLVKAGLERCKELGFGAVVVLGHIGYYPRFGFIPAVRYGIGCEYEVPQDAFMAMELQPGYLTGARGIVKYHPAFNDV